MYQNERFNYYKAMHIIQNDPESHCLRTYSLDLSSRSQCESQIRQISGNFTFIIAYHSELETNLSASISRINFIPTIYDEVDFFKNAVGYPF